MNNEKDYLKSINFPSHLKNLINECENKKILIYGAGLLFETAQKYYDFSKLNIIGISDKRFEDDKSTETFCKIKTYKPSEISSINPDIILIATKEYNSILRYLKKSHNCIILPLFKKPTKKAFLRRNIYHNLYVEKQGLHGKKPSKLPLYKKIKIRLNSLLGKIDIPQIEFNITTICTLKCKHCSNFIPQIKPQEHCIISIDEFKVQIDNLLRAVNEVKNLLLIGGEPLLVKNLHEYLDYAASKKKIKRVWIVTNGTLLMNDFLIKTAQKYKNKLTIWVSNYSKNPELKSKLKHDELLKQIKDNNLDYDYVQDLTWGYTSPLTPKKLREDSKQYFEECGNNCVAVFKGKIYICPRAGVFALKGIYTPELNEVIDLNIENNPKILKKKLINFYSRESFSACNYCTILEDRTQDRILPAQQITD